MYSGQAASPSGTSVRAGRIVTVRRTDAVSRSAGRRGDAGPFVADMIGNPQARAIIRSVIGLGRGLGVPVVAEGVETTEQLDALRDEGCDQVQGYLISRPNPIGHFEGVVLDRGRADELKKRAARR